jgi:hypothetical protein
MFFPGVVQAVVDWASPPSFRRSNRHMIQKDRHNIAALPRTRLLPPPKNRSSGDLGKISKYFPLRHPRFDRCDVRTHSGSACTHRFDLDRPVRIFAPKPFESALQLGDPLLFFLAGSQRVHRCGDRSSNLRQRQARDDSFCDVSFQESCRHGHTRSADFAVACRARVDGGPVPLTGCECEGRAEDAGA